MPSTFSTTSQLVGNTYCGRSRVVIFTVQHSRAPLFPGAVTSCARFNLPPTPPATPLRSCHRSPNPSNTHTHTHTLISPSSAHLSSPSSSSFSSFFHSSWTNREKGGRERSFLLSSGFPLSRSAVRAVEQHRQTNINDRPGRGRGNGLPLNRRDEDPRFL